MLHARFHLTVTTVIPSKVQFLLLEHEEISRGAIATVNYSILLLAPQLLCVSFLFVSQILSGSVALLFLHQISIMYNL